MSDRPSDVAIIAMNGRFPGAPSVARLWENLCAGVDAAVVLSDEQLRAAGVPEILLADPAFVRLAQLLPEADLFDAVHFDYSAREAEIIDPQQRLFLECAWELLETAGHDPERFPGRIGVVAAVSRNGYHEAVLRSLADPIATFEAQIGNDKDYVATRVGYKLNLRGPCFTVQTACSSSLVAVHLACQLLLAGEADMVIAGGVSVREPQTTGYLYKEGFILSPDGRCRAFDATASGCNAGNGAALVLLRRLDDALADGDDVQAVVRGSAINNDGADKAGFTAPGAAGQAAVIAEAITVAGVDAASIGYVEAHGTGTPIGDPIEVSALTQVYRAATAARRSCALGSLKTAIGHLDAAAGAAGLIKAALAVRHGVVPPSPYFSGPNPEARLEASPFFVNRELIPWPSGAGPRRAAVSSFGIGGTNAHVVLEEAPPPAPAAAAARPAEVLVLSAKTAAALDAAAARLARHLAETPGLDLADVAFTLQTGRRRLRHRLAVVAEAHQGAGALAGAAAARVIDDAGGVPVAFLFPGGGAQHPGMAHDLYRYEPRFRAEIDRCAALLRDGSDLDLHAILGTAGAAPAAGGGGGGAALPSGTAMRRASLALPALFAVEYALARLWMDWGVRPWALLGHSLGEYTAACLAGVFSLADALRIVTLRARLFEQLPAGAMLSVPLGESELTPLLGDDVDVAAVNGPALAVASGTAPAIEALAARLAARGVEARRLQIDVAAHSRLVAPVLAPFAALLDTVPLSPPRIPLLSNVTGTWARAEDVTDPAYWVRHLRHTVRFAGGVAELLKTPRQVLLEVGPGRTLSNCAAAAPGRSPATATVTSLRHPQDPQTDLETLLAAAGKLWALGVDLSWTGHHGGGRRRVALPTYPFARQRYRIQPAPPAAERSAPWAPAAAGEHYLVLPGAAAGAGRPLAAALAAAGHRVTTAEPGERFARLAEDRYAVRPGDAGDLGRLLEALAPAAPAAAGALAAALAAPPGGILAIPLGPLAARPDAAAGGAAFAGGDAPAAGSAGRGPAAAAPASAASAPGAGRHPRPALTTLYLAPRDETEAAVAALFEELLHLSPVGVEDSFFEMGGNSLVAAQLLSRLRAAFRAAPQLSQLFAAPTAAGIAALLRAAAGEPDAAAAAPAGVPAAAAVETGEI
jgi:phthiocerol/phenolphthiocerol synthesis type-I polyketide synthase E